MVLQTSQTMVLRVRQQSANAQAIVGYLEKRPKVTKEHHPGLASHPHKDLADKYHRNGVHGGMLWFGIVEVVVVCCWFCWWLFAPVVLGKIGRKGTGCLDISPSRIRC